MFATVVALIGASAPGQAIAGPPSDPPGKSGDAPGHQKNDEAPGQAKHDESPAAEAPAAVTQAPVEVAVAQPAPAVAPVESPRFENAAGKPKRNVPAAAEAAPETSISAPGNSGRHKLTICHKGHAITVDVHAARAHVDGHGDTYAAAGAKGRAACPQLSSPPPQNERPGKAPEPPAARAETAPVGVAPATAAPASASVPEAPAATPAGPKDPAGGVSAAVGRADLGGVASTATEGSLPFTGAPLTTLALLGLGLVAAGSALVAGARRSPQSAPARARKRAA